MKNFRMIQTILILILFIFPLSACSKKSESPIADVNLGATISGLITVAPELQSKISHPTTVFIIARKDVGPPLAVKKMIDPTFPLAYILSAEDAMFPGTPFQGEVKVTARIDKDGNAGPAQPGDLEGVASKNPARVGDRNVDIVIDKGL